MPKPAIVNDYVPYGSARKQQMAAYCRRHYGAAQATWVLKPKAVVLHYTAGGSYSSAHNYFSSNAPNLGELPGVCAHFIIDKNGKIYQQLPLGVRCRHTIGLNYAAVGIEFVQEAGIGTDVGDQPDLQAHEADQRRPAPRALAEVEVQDADEEHPRSRHRQRQPAVQGPQGLAQRSCRLGRRPGRALQDEARGDE